MKRFSWLLLGLAAVVPAIQLVALALSPSDYTYFIDEFYYIACSEHLAFGYVDHPPLAPWLLAFTRLFLGDSLLGIRVVPFLAAGATVWLTGELAQELGGGRFATILAALAFGLSPVFIGMTGFFSMNAFEPFLWSAVMLTLVRLVRTGSASSAWQGPAHPARLLARGASTARSASSRKLWLLAGLLAGLAFENKHTIVAYIAALGAGIVGARVIERANRTEARTLRDGWMWAGAAIALLLTLPNVAWQTMNGWPSLEFYRNAQTMKNIPVAPLQSLGAQALAMNPVTFPIWLAGLTFLLFSRHAKAVRFAGLMFLALLAMHVAARTSRPDRMLAAYPMLMAAGGVALERMIRRPVSRIAAASVVAVSGAALALMFVPLLPPAAEARYVAFFNADIKAERGKTSPIPQLMADRTGWRSFMDDMGRAYRRLPAADQRRAIIYVPDYGHAGALDLWGPQAGLPRVIASQNSYWHWSDGHASSDVLIAVGSHPGDLEKVYRTVTRVDTVRCDYCMSWRSRMPVYVAKDPIVPLDRVWRLTRFYE